jgi:hypothetical protein
MDHELRFLTRHWLDGALASLSSELNSSRYHNQQHSTITFGGLPLAGVSCLLTCSFVLRPSKRPKLTFALGSRGWNSVFRFEVLFSKLGNWSSGSRLYHFWLGEVWLACPLVGSVCCFDVFWPPVWLIHLHTFVVANSAVAAGLFWSLCLSYGKGPCLRALTARPEEKKGDGWIDGWMDG